VLPSQRDWDGFYDLVRRRADLDLAQYKPGQLQRRILGMVESKNCANLEAFGVWVNASPLNTQWFLDKLAINVSELFRNPEKWDEMEKQVIPSLLRNTARLKIWSAGCSYGAEAHTLAMILDANFPGAHSIVGTDIDHAALEQAKKGEFNEADARGVPSRYRKYLTQEGAVWTADQKLRKYLNFQKQNLLKDRFEPGHDLIMCRNVVIYFTDEAKDKLYERFFEALKPGGILFVGSTERIFKSNEIGFETAWPFFYRKPLLGNKTWRNAS